MSTRVHSRYHRTLSDVAAGGQQASVRVRARRFFCDAAGCPARTFAEQVEGLTTRHARRTPLLRSTLEAIALALAGRAGSRLAGHLAIPVSRNTLLRLVRALPEADVGTVAVLGVDDFALRRGHVYATVLVDVGSGRPVDLLPDREAATFAEWLRAHPGTEVVCRDRAGGYAEGARTGAPDAAQVADRWHLWHNLAEHVEASVARHRGCLAAPADPEPDSPAAEADADRAADMERVAAERVEARALVRRTRQRHAAVHALLSRGKSARAVARELNLALGTVRRFARAADVEDLLAVARDGQPSILDAFKPHLHHRWAEGCTNVSALFAEVRAMGYRGGYGTVHAYLRRLPPGVAPPAVPAPPKVREVTGWLLRHPDNLTADEQVRLKGVLARCRHLDAVAGHVTAFAEMLTGLHGERLDGWLAAVETDDLPGLHRFTRGLRRDHAAVRNGLTTAHSSGVVEGNVNRIKTLKRQMYGRASFALLRKRVLLTA